MMKAGTHTMTPNQETKLNIATTWIPVSFAVALIGSLIYGTWAIFNERAAIHGRIDNLSIDVKAIVVTVEKLADNIAKPNSLAFTQQDHINDCLRHQIANPTWKCIYADAVSDHAKGIR